jgi:hypothetical protein
MKNLKIVIIVFFAIVGAFLGFISYAIIPSILFGDPRIFFDIEGFFPVLWRNLLYTAGMLGLGGAICGMIGGFGIGVGTAIDEKFNYFLIIPIGILYGFRGLLMIGFAGTFIAIFPGVFFIAVLRDFVSIIVLILYLLAFAAACGVLSGGMLYRNFLKN